MIASVSSVVESLLDLQLVDSDLLRQRLERLGADVGLNALVADLTFNRLLSPYQAKQILAGKVRELVLGGYRLIEPIGEGGMGQVFKASQMHLNRKVALKVIAPHLIGDEQAVRRFQREALAAASLKHPNIVVIHDFNHVDGAWFLVMEYVDGTDLSKLVKQRGTLGIREACVYIRQAAEGLQHAHDAGLIHRDVKPHNLLLTYPKDVSKQSSATLPLSAMLRTPAQQRKPALAIDPEEAVVKLLDLGLARVVAGDGEPTLTNTNALLGTPDYISPEQSRDPRNVDARADIYSLGCTFYFLLAGHPPFADRSVVDKLIAHQTEAPIPIEHHRPQVPAAIAEVIRKSMAKKPDRRYRTVRDVAVAIDAYLRTGRVSPESVPVPRPREALVSEETPSNHFPDAKTSFQPIPILSQPPAAPSPPPADEGERTKATQLEKRSKAEVLVEVVPPGQPTRSAVFQAHQGQITGLAISSEGRLLATCGHDDVVRVWSLVTSSPTELACSPPIPGARSLCFSPGMKQIAIGSDEPIGHVTLWNWRQDGGRSWTSAEIDKVPSAGIAYSADGTMLAAGVGPLIFTWRLNDQKARLRARLKGHQGVVKCLAFSIADGSLASGGEDGTVRQWQFGRLWSGQKAAAVAHRGAVEDLTWSPDGQFVATGGVDERIRAWDPSAVPPSGARGVGKVDGAVRQVMWVGEGMLAFSDRGQLVRWEHLGDPASASQWVIDSGLVTASALSRTGMVALGGSDGRVQIFHSPG